MMTIAKTCRDCGGGKLTLFLDLGDQPPANAFIAKDVLATRKEEYFPLQAYVCEDCQLVQLIHIVDLDTLFQDYVYLTAGAGPTTPKHFTDYAKSVTDKFALGKDSFVVELGSNDGLLLRAFKEAGVGKIQGVDPAKNVAKLANDNGIATIALPWGKEVAQDIAKKFGKADLIVGNNVVAHIADHEGLVEGVKTLLKDSGVFVLEAPYLVDMFENLSFDTIYHEHLACLSLRPLQKFFSAHGLEAFAMELSPAQGVSMRLFVGWKGAHGVSPSINEFAEKELSLRMDKVASYLELGARVSKRKDDLLGLLSTLKKDGKRIVGYGAPAKGNTLLNYAKIGTETLEYLTEELPTKIGKFSPGMHIPVVHIDEARKDPPDYFLVLAWNYLEKILEREKELRGRGVKFIVPIGPELQVL